MNTDTGMPYIPSPDRKLPDAGRFYVAEVDCIDGLFGTIRSARTPDRRYIVFPDIYPHSVKLGEMRRI